jgi:hypothetical protein
MNAAFWGLTGVTGLLSVLLAAWVWDYHEGDAAGQGLTQAYSALAALLLWLLLGALLTLCGVRGALPGRVKFYVALVFVVALTGQFLSFSMLSGTSKGDFADVILRSIVMLSPWLVILYCLGTAYTGLRGLQPIAAGTLVSLSALAGIVWVPRLAEVRQQRATVDQAYAEEHAKLESIRAMPDDTPLDKLLAYTNVPGMFTTEMPETARARIRKLPRRQEEIQALLARDSELAFIQLNCFDIDVTPGICSAARKNLARIAGQWRANASNPDPRLSDLAGPIRFLVHRGCECGKELDLIREALEAAPESFEKDHFLKQLATIRATHGAE